VKIARAVSARDASKKPPNKIDARRLPVKLHGQVLYLLPVRRST
jgi:hypothetical protein